jgi:predicted O-linked N-acetylglucosamine transferase (SPINDLY family)
MLRFAMNNTDALRPEDYKAHGDAAMGAGDFEGAKAAYLECLRLTPANVGAALGLARAARELGRLDQAAKVLEAALVFTPEHPALLSTLGAALHEAGSLMRAATVLRAALERNPGNPDAAHNLGNVLADSGDLAGAAAAAELALRSAPTDRDMVAAALTVLLHDPSITGAALVARTRAIVAAAGGLPQRQTAPRRPGPLRLGWVTSDFHSRHPVAQNTIPLLRALGAGFVNTVYADIAPGRHVPNSYRAAADVWRDVYGMPDPVLAEIVRQDGIEILLILAGRFDANRALLGRLRAAPVQISLHDPATSGFANVDYIILDRFLAPRAHQAFFTERIVRLPSFYTHDPIEAPDVAPPPMLRSGVLTLGCYNRPIKINQRVLDLWARVLAEIPGSRLVLKNKRYRAAELRQRMLEPFLRRGIAADRVEFREADLDWRDHMASYGEIDIALDPFPFSGSTTTFETLWMGVPVVTLPGDTAVSRWTGSMLRTMGLGELIAGSEQEYVAIVRQLAAQPDRLAHLRLGLRARLAASPLCNISQRARQFSRVLRALWRHHRILMS